jgi:hypothetical protein
VNGPGRFTDAEFFDPPALELSLRYHVFDHGGLSLESEGAGASTGAEYARIQPDRDLGAPAGVAIFGLHQNGTLITETGVPASTRIRNGRIPVQTDARTRTGLALANPNDQEVSVDYYVTDAEGSSSPTGRTTVPARCQVVRFLDESPFNGGSAFSGAFTFSASAAVAAVAFRGTTNERSEFLITTLAVVDLDAAAGSEAVVLSHFAEGGGWTTEVDSMRPTASTCGRGCGTGWLRPRAWAEFSRPLRDPQSCARPAGSGRRREPKAPAA